MAERMTSIHLPGYEGSGIALYGRHAPEEMLQKLREYAEYRYKAAAAILMANPEDFRIETYTGVHVRNNLTVLQEGRKE